MKDFSKDIEQCLAVLHAGGTILYPTDTIWGIGCDATNTNAVEKIIALKQRPQEKSFVVLVASEKEILQHVAAPDLAIFDFLQNTLKPVTVIYQHALALAENVIADDGSVAMRICKDEFCRQLIRRFRKPLVSTSANVSGKPSPVCFAEIEKNIISGVDYVVQYRQEETVKTQASAIIKWINGKPEYIRK